MDGLTERQEQLLRFIEAYGEMHGFPPSIREMAEHMGIRSTNGVNDHLKALLRKGFIRREGQAKSRALSLARRRGAASFREEPAVSVPILGRVAAGQPILAEENLEGRLPVGRSLLRGAGDVFALRVRGESMIGKGILDGDLVIVRSQNAADPGQVVVAMLEGEVTVKTFRPEKDRVVFEPANPAMQPIVVRREDFRQTDILGVVIGVYREVR
ncbi:MAG: transcriptional repressor LexA [Myxococcales bacterium]|nr:transcriptional repressor LexA [Myxococcales bacterium]